MASLLYNTAYEAHTRWNIARRNGEETEKINIIITYHEPSFTIPPPLSREDSELIQRVVEHVLSEAMKGDRCGVVHCSNDRLFAGFLPWWTECTSLCTPGGLRESRLVGDVFVDPAVDSEALWDSD